MSIAKDSFTMLCLARQRLHEGTCSPSECCVRQGSPVFKRRSVTAGLRECLLSSWILALTLSSRRAPVSATTTTTTSPQDSSHVRVVPYTRGRFESTHGGRFVHTHGEQGVIVSSAYQNLPTCGHHVIQRFTKETSGSSRFSV